MKHQVSIFVKIGLALFLALIVIMIFSISMQYNKLVKQRDALKTQVEKEQLQLEKLIEEANGEFDDEYIKKIAREELGYRMPDEIIFYNNIKK